MTVFLFQEVRKLTDEELFRKFSEIEGQRRNFGVKENFFLCMVLKKELKRRKLKVEIY